MRIVDRAVMGWYQFFPSPEGAMKIAAIAINDPGLVPVAIRTLDAILRNPRGDTIFAPHRERAQGYAIDALGEIAKEDKGNVQPAIDVLCFIAAHGRNVNHSSYAIDALKTANFRFGAQVLSALALANTLKAIEVMADIGAGPGFNGHNAISCIKGTFDYLSATSPRLTERELSSLKLAVVCGIKKVAIESADTYPSAIKELGNVCTVEAVQAIEAIAKDNPNAGPVAMKVLRNMAVLMGEKRAVAMDAIVSIAKTGKPVDIASAVEILKAAASGSLLSPNAIKCIGDIGEIEAANRSTPMTLHALPRLVQIFEQACARSDGAEIAATSEALQRVVFAVTEPKNLVPILATGHESALKGALNRAAVLPELVKLSDWVKAIESGNSASMATLRADMFPALRAA